MQLLHLFAAWLFPCAVCTTTMTAADDGAGGMAAEPSSSPLSSSSTGDRLEFGTSSSRWQQRSRSASPPCFGARISRLEKRQAAKAAPNGQPATDETTTEHHPRKSRSPPASRSANVLAGPASSTSPSPTSSPPTSLRDRLGLTTSPPRGCSASPPHFCAHGGGGGALSRSPEAEKGRAVASYLRRISSRLTTRSAAADDESLLPPTTVPNSFPLIGDGRRKAGSAIATEEEIRAFVIANGSRAIPSV